jgi:UDP-N-acetylglucosamine 2-epimerase (non-hydrolysing)
VTVYLGARPNVPKAWTLQQALRAAATVEPAAGFTWSTVHTGQHTHPLLGQDLCDELEVRVDRNLGVAGGETTAERISALMIAIEADIRADAPSAVVAIGDVNTALACALVCARERIPLIHLEAGLRSGVETVEEINRRIIAACAQFHLATTESAARNLLAEGVPADRIWQVGNPMAECFLRTAQTVEDEKVLAEFGLVREDYVLATLHKSDTLTASSILVGLISEIAQDLPVVFPCHPQTQLHLTETGLFGDLHERVTVLPPLPYRAFGALLRSARAVVTDSDGVQEECAIGRVRCLSLVSATARPEILEADRHVSLNAWISRPREAVRERWNRQGTPPSGWDERVSHRIALAVPEILHQLPARPESSLLDGVGMPTLNHSERS